MIMVSSIVTNSAFSSQHSAISSQHSALSDQLLTLHSSLFTSAALEPENKIADDDNCSENHDHDILACQSRLHDPGRAADPGGQEPCPIYQAVDDSNVDQFPQHRYRQRLYGAHYCSVVNLVYLVLLFQQLWRLPQRLPSEPDPREHYTQDRNDRRHYGQ